MLNSEKIAKNLSEASQAVGENTIDVINSAVRALEKIEEIDSKYSSTIESLRNIYYEMQEIHYWCIPQWTHQNSGTGGTPETDGISYDKRCKGE